MNKVAALLIFPFASVGCGGALDSEREVGPRGVPLERRGEPEVAEGPPGVLHLRASSVSGVTTGRPLPAGATFTVVIQGTMSIWRVEHWSNICAGAPGPGPLFPSPGSTGPVGSDAEWVWAWPRDSESLCPSGAPVGPPPQPARMLLVQTGRGGFPVALPAPQETGMTGNHAYTYSITGEGLPAVFFINDSPIADNYGELQIRITPVP